MVEFRKARCDDAHTIIVTRKKCWDATYRGIYPDEAIDEFDFAWHLKAEQRRLSNPDFHCWMVLDEGKCVGYFSCGPVSPGNWKDFGFRLHSLYLLPKYQNRGLGRRIFEQVKAFCIKSGFDKLYLDCHPENQNALAFYQHVGGVIIYMDAGHENKQEDSCTIEFRFEPEI